MACQLLVMRPVTEILDEHFFSDKLLWKHSGPGFPGHTRIKL